ncbi:hypothetical protein [Granulicella sp. WH15]|uniref:hypothetical protein n=1 Tax=Granulicella sp. WH15 TaxID=2602070 RepID=UPI0015F2B435|nr:hypothetical protein [Granulicella sp. WH15]
MAREAKRWLLTAVALGMVLGTASDGVGEEYKPPRKVPGIRPCPRFAGPSRRVMDHGREAIEMVTKMNVDVDGAPNAYGPPGKKALDIAEHSLSPADAEHPGAVVGYMTEYEGGPPTVQKPGDPYPGYYVSQTDFADKDNPRMEDPRRYVDATKINYLVQGRVARKAGVVMGDYATVYSCRTGKSAFAIVADSGNERGDEGSLALVQALGYPIKDGIDQSVDDPEIVIHYFPKSNPGKTFFKTQAALDEAAAKLGLRK